VAVQLQRLGVGSAELREAELLRAARSKTGLRDFGDEAFREPLQMLVRSINTEARLHPVGRAITQLRLIGALCTRLRVAERVKREPALLQRTLPAPIVIAGLQRTGTTLLHRLLASDPTLRALHSFEAIAPVSPRSVSRFGLDPRLYQAKLSERALRYMAPEFFAIHQVEALAPEEDVLLLDYAFMSTVPEATLHVPSYARWLEAQDHTPAYEYLALLLKLIAGDDARRWVLKTPHHLEYLDVLRKVFPGVAIIQTHRDPVRTLASFCSMIWHARGVFSDAVDAHEVGRHWSRKVGRMLERGLTVRAAAADRGFVDVAYDALIQDPVRCIEQVYAGLGLPFGEPVERALETTRAENPQHKYGVHRYELADFGLSAAGVEPLFARYRARFGAQSAV
jgi:hypothetical protein